jgi:hypothetical protein
MMGKCRNRNSFNPKIHYFKIVYNLSTLASITSFEVICNKMNI